MKKQKGISTRHKSSVHIKNTTAGITLIALVITIIVLLILAGVSISLVVGENGVLNQASTSVVKTREAEAREEVSVAWASMETEYLAEWTQNTSLAKDKDYIKDKLDKYLEDTGEIVGDLAYDEASEIYTFTYKPYDDNMSYEMTISANGKVQVVGEGTSSGIENSLASQITAINYGDKVNYVASNGYNDWKIFYSNGTNVFLIASGYVDKTLVTAGMEQYNNTSDPYSVYWSGVPSAMSITARQDELFGITSSSYELNSSYQNSKCVSTMLDTANWTGFKDTKGYGEYAVGGPTLEMWKNSWNEKGELVRKDAYRVLKIQKGIYGYYVGQEGIDLESVADNYEAEDFGGYSYCLIVDDEAGGDDTLYFPTPPSNSNCEGYWLASPSTEDSSSLFHIFRRGCVYTCKYDSTDKGVRPVVALSSSVKGTQGADGTWRLSK